MAVIPLAGFAVVNGGLRTPPADGRILPGVTRAAVLKAARLNGIEVTTGAITRAQLAGASEVFVTNALRGVMPVQAIGDTPVAGAPGPVARLLAAALARRPADRGSPAQARRAAVWPASRAAGKHGIAKPAIVLIMPLDNGWAAEGSQTRASRPSRMGDAGQAVR